MTASAVAALAAAALVVRSHLRVRDAVSRVAPELRSPLLPYVAVPLTRKKLRAFR
ncbi:MAG: hypothetical protein ACXWEI_23700 [Mycobacterium sp.]